jgi:UDP-N-acetylglucosamine 2-epimerase (non-hydrolysing)
MKTVVILGTRPEIIKMSPVIRALEQLKSDYFILHTGQHYSYNMDRVFFEQLNLPEAKYNLEVGSGTHAEQTAKILIGVEKVLFSEKPDVILVQGDTNTVLAAALAAAKLHIKIGHVEAGLRSYDRRMPEELNRILTDHCSDYLFAPTEKARDILLAEGIPSEKIFVTGNTVVDAVYQNLEIASASGNILKTLNLQPENYFLVTLHRQENVDDRSRFGSILSALNELTLKYKMPVIYPIHPRARKMMQEFKLTSSQTSSSPTPVTYNLEPKTYNSPCLHLLDPVDYFSFLQLEKHARLVLTDSGGVQEESCILGVPCVTLRDNTERPETLEVGANLLAETAQDKILACVETLINNRNSWNNPFGDGKAGNRIIDNIIPKETRSIH